MKNIICIVFLLIVGCKANDPKTRGFYSASQVGPKESFYYQDNDIYHVSSRNDTTTLNWGDIRILGIDSLKRQYLYNRTEK